MKESKQHRVLFNRETAANAKKKQHVPSELNIALYGKCAIFSSNNRYKNAHILVTQLHTFPGASAPQSQNGRKPQADWFGDARPC